MDELELARDLSLNGDLDNAYRIVDKNLKQDPNSAEWLQVLTYIMLGSHKPTVAYQLAKRTTQLAPKKAGTWLNLGMAANDLWRTSEAERCYKRGIKLSNDKEQLSMLYVNLASVLIDTGRFDEAEKYASKAIECNPDSIKGKANLGFCQLAQRNWKEGWKNYRHTIGCEWRPRQQYGDEPDWDGKSKGNIVIWADQGLGDVISFGSMIPDLSKWAKENNSQIVLDIDKRLEGLFKRSFPDVTVYGTRGAKHLTWSKAHREVHYSLPLGQVGEYFRNEESDFPGTPYLTPDKDRVFQWEALFKSKKKPTIGIAWSGGIERTGAKFRRVDLDALKPLFESVDAHWVSLQYKPASKEIAAFREKYPEVDLVEYPHGTLTGDYDDTVAMVAALDMVVAVHTTVIHVAGGLGVPCWTLVPQNSQWRYGTGHEDYVWADSIRIIRQTQPGKWNNEITKIAEDLNARFTGVRKATAKATRKGKLRGNGSQVRVNGIGDNRQAGNQPSA